jgi:spore germination protein YaaH
MDFKVPERTGVGKILTDKQLNSLRDAHCKRQFYSSGLCANYFNYTDNMETHFVLYDDADTIKKKLTLASSLGIRTAFLYYPHVSDILPQLRGFSV